MKKFNYFFAAGFLLFVSCVAKDKLPENPKDKQEYRDSQGNSWIWNAMLMRWALTPSGGGSPSYFYYPGNGSWTNSGGVKVDPPRESATYPMALQNRILSVPRLRLRAVSQHRERALAAVSAVNLLAHD